MLNRWLFVLVFAGGILLGYAFGAPSVQAQPESAPLALGDTVTLYYTEKARHPSSGSMVECVVAEIRGTFVRCTPPSRIGGTGGRDVLERWVTTQHLIQVVKRRD
jgi:hypothetical protein